MDELNPAKLEAIRRRWAATRHNVLRASWWKSWDAADAGLLLSLFLPIILVPLEMELWGIEYELWSFTGNLERLPGHWVLICALAVCLINAVFIHRLLSRKGRPEERAPAWRRLLHFTVAGLPLYGLCWIAAKRRAIQGPGPAALQSCPGGTTALRSRNPTFRLQSHAARRLDLWLRRLESSGWWGAWFVGVNFLLLLGISIWLAAPKPVSVPRWLVLSGLVVALRLSAFQGVRQYLGKRAFEISRSSRHMRLLQRLSYTWLIPLPGLPLLSMAVLLGYESECSRANTLTHAAYLSRHSMRRLSGWSDLRESVQRSWRKRYWFKHFLSLGGSMPRPIQRAPVPARQLTSLYRLKALLLWIDGTALGVYHPLWTLPALFALSVSVLSIGLLVAIVESRPLEAHNRKPTCPHVGLSEATSKPRYGTYMAATATIFSLGTCTGVAVALGEVRLGGLLVAVPPIIACLVGGLSIMLRPCLPRSGADTGLGEIVLWFALLLALEASGLFILLDEETADRFLNLLFVLTLTVPVWHFVVAALLIGWLLRPFCLKDIGSPRIPPLYRLRLILLTATCSLPFGGLAIPVWIRLRQRSLIHDEEVWLNLRSNPQG